MHQTLREKQKQFTFINARINNEMIPIDVVRRPLARLGEKSNAIHPHEKTLASAKIISRSITVSPVQDR